MGARRKSYGPLGPSLGSFSWVLLFVVLLVVLLLVLLLVLLVVLLMVFLAVLLVVLLVGLGGQVVSRGRGRLLGTWWARGGQAVGGW